jgi:hypothetical protein
VKQVDQLLAEHVTPVLAGHGFKRFGRKYVGHLPAGTLVLEFRGKGGELAPGILAHWGLIPPVVSEYYQQKTGKKVPVVEWAPLQKAIMPVDGYWIVPEATEWVVPLDEAGRAACGRSLVRVLQSRLIPLWKALADSAVLARESDTWTDGGPNLGIHWWASGTRANEWRVVTSEIDTADPKVLSRLLDTIEANQPDERVAWFRERLRARVQRESGTDV